MNRVLLGILAGAVLLPVLLLKTGYGFVNSFPYGSYQPLAVIVGHYLSIPMLLGSVCGLFLGMIHPRLALWWGKADRYSVARVYIVVFLCGIFLQYEIRVLRGFVSKGESSAVAELYERLDAGLPKDELLAVQRRVAGGLRYTNGNDSDFIRTPGFPINGISTSVLKFAPPGYRMRDGVVVQLSARWDDPDARSERMVLIQDDLVVAVKPALAESDPRIYWGTLVIGPERQTFTPCGEPELALDTSEFLDLRADRSTEYDFYIEYFRNGRAPYERTRAILVGYKDTAAEGARFRILRWMLLESEQGFSSYTCDKPQNGL